MLLQRIDMTAARTVGTETPGRRYAQSFGRHRAKAPAVPNNRGRDNKLLRKAGSCPLEFLLFMNRSGLTKPDKL